MQVHTYEYAGPKTHVSLRSLSCGILYTTYMYVAATYVSQRSARYPSLHLSIDFDQPYY